MAGERRWVFIEADLIASIRGKYKPEYQPPSNFNIGLSDLEMQRRVHEALVQHKKDEYHSRLATEPDFSRFDEPQTRKRRR